MRRMRLASSLGSSAWWKPNHRLSSIIAQQRAVTLASGSGRRDCSVKREASSRASCVRLYARSYADLVRDPRFAVSEIRYPFFGSRFCSHTPGAIAVLVDELDAGRFEGAPNEIIRSATRLTHPSFQAGAPSRCPPLKWAFGWVSRQTAYSFFSVRLRIRTPGPPPFSSMNSTPADSNARRTAKSFAMVMDVSFSAPSARRMVASPRAASRARSSALHRRRPRAALI
jgi:hypothetical protein